ncbi:hypothetical protein HYR99_03970 [Candidatus Poribacteria bacterium]|nr:hypothetical protein [Candidatus Poribacteria bacterium]
MLDILVLIGLIISTVLLVIVFLRLQRSASKQDILDLNHLIQQGRAKTCVENVEKVKKGNTKDEVELLMGKADSLTDTEWIYYLDPHSGYVVSFDSGSQVEAVNLWVS